MIKINREVSFGTILQLIGYIVMVVYFTAQISANLVTVRSDLDDLKVQLTKLQDRMDKHIDTK